MPATANLLRCNQCGFYSHLACSKTDLGALERHARNFNAWIEQDTGVPGTETAKSIYKCIDCLLVDRLPSFYIYQQCELYESLHQSIQRQALLYSLVSTIVGRYLAEVADPDLYISHFINQNLKFFREDRLIQQWLALLDSAPAQQMTDSQSCTEVDSIMAAQDGKKEEQQAEKKEEETKVEEKKAAED